LYQGDIIGYNIQNLFYDEKTTKFFLCFEEKEDESENFSEYQPSKSFELKDLKAIIPIEYFCYIDRIDNYIEMMYKIPLHGRGAIYKPWRTSLKKMLTESIGLRNEKLYKRIFSRFYYNWDRACSTLRRDTDNKWVCSCDYLSNCWIAYKRNSFEGLMPPTFVANYPNFYSSHMK
jgi:hypothetical protein